jgi:hypothetical protein
MRRRRHSIRNGRRMFEDSTRATGCDDGAADLDGSIRAEDKIAK